MSRINAYFVLSRPINLFLSAITALITATFFIPFPSWYKVAVALFAVVFLNAGANAVNDLYDEAIDRINRPNRPLPSGKLSPKNVRIFAIITFVLGNLSALFAGWISFIIAAVIATPLMIFYSLYFKRTPFMGNFVIAVILGLAFIFCSATYGDMSRGITPALLAFFYTLIREIIKDLEDMKGDRAGGARTLPLLLGEKKTRIITALLLIFLVVILPFPVHLSFYSTAYLKVVLPFVGLPLLGIAVWLFVPRENFNYGFLSQILKIDMFAGLAAIYAGVHF
ncbi:MAG: geranylgeranylglycerol-phosphate geranylgeranyltransferase [Candidatus Marinimicrobia bacterium]|nr:geranylgeranylglycerol-phosphate geranylgeranyltransferase [Candidatus Neomarinimicrobiota bacterium]